LSLISLALGFWVFEMLIFINRHQAELNGLSGGSSIAMVGGISSCFGGYGSPCRHLSPLQVLRQTSGRAAGQASVVSFHFR
jgi:hypothetical protein